MTRRTYSRHGLNALKAVVKVRGLDAIDMRTSAARGLLRWRAELLADLGGPAVVSAQASALVDLIVRTRLYVDNVDAWLMAQPSLVLSKRRTLLPVLQQRQQLADSLARMLGQLGLERRAKPVLSASAIIARKALDAAKAPAPTPPPSSPAATPEPTEAAS